MPTERLIVIAMLRGFVSLAHWLCSGLAGGVMTATKTRR
jgi:hypothetical protein